MDVFGKGTDEPSRPLLSPAVCFICENSPSQDAHRVIDTRREFNPEALTRLSGRKYICEPCATEMGGAMGLVSPEQYSRVRDERDATMGDLVVVSAKLARAEESQVHVVAVNEIVDVISETVRVELSKQIAVTAEVPQIKLMGTAPRKPAASKATGDKA